ncbi:ovarian-specific serine/threonine-protein kinase lok [Anaeramoeba ignava]|uniref:Ovarian-specific serine/threonine-protein kinase lok n=1 Tax=Anaeramoeba ignava TaxID=1746090 RepID=A0A9Q0LH81_ANAIG|nr:ovarian-specific serine/threonine-protein kinase lok [Anaeramoeba ignava]
MNFLSLNEFYEFLSSQKKLEKTKPKLNKNHFQKEIYQTKISKQKFSNIEIINQKGYYSTILSAQNSKGEYFAIKLYKSPSLKNYSNFEKEKEENQKKPNLKAQIINRFIQEINIINHLEKNPNIIKMIDWGLTQPNLYPFIVLPLYQNSLSKKYQENQLDFSSFILKGVETLKFIHFNNVIHQDLKIDNILFDSSSNLILCDWNSALFFSDENFEKISFQKDLIGFGKILARIILGKIKGKLSIQQIKNSLKKVDEKNINNNLNQSKNLLIWKDLIFKLLNITKFYNLNDLEKFYKEIFETINEKKMKK